MSALDGYRGMEATDPTGPAGHAYGLRVSSRLTTDYRQRTGRGCVDVTPQQVIDCLRNAEIKNWVLMGLHGLVGYLPMPRATQDVDVMVGYNEKVRAVKAIATTWPMLTQVNLSQVIRFLDPADLDPAGKPKPVINLMLPWGKYQETILKEHVLIDEATGSRYPTVEAVWASKYGALVSPHRSRDKKEQDTADFRRVAQANMASIRVEPLRQLGDQIWEQGGAELLRFIALVREDKPLPI